jgi:hypothetical protein
MTPRFGHQRRLHDQRHAVAMAARDRRRLEQRRIRQQAPERRERSSSMPAQFKDPADYTPAEHLRAVQAGRRGQPEPRVETDAQSAARDAGFEPIREGDFGHDGVIRSRLEAMTPADHLKAIQGREETTR